MNIEPESDLGKAEHIPVLKKEVVELLDPKPGENFIDCTLGWGGHAFAILEKNAPDGKVLGIERDEESLKNFLAAHPESERQRLIIARGNFADLGRIAVEHNFVPASGVVMDLGMSSWHLSDSGRGFSFLDPDEPLDMRYDPGAGRTAAEIVNTAPPEELEQILREYGQERFARAIARTIVRARGTKPIETTGGLVSVIKKAVPPRFAHGKTHFATRTFQAIRIAANDELKSLEMALPQAYEILAPGGRIVVISFHSLEDRIVKNFFRALAKEGRAEILTKKPITPIGEEIKLNPRSRSAKLRTLAKKRAPENTTA